LVAAKKIKMHFWSRGSTSKPSWSNFYRGRFPDRNGGTIYCRLHLRVPQTKPNKIVLRLLEVRPASKVMAECVS